MEKTSKKVIEKIKKEAIKPKPVWYFYLAKLFLYLFSLIAIILGGLALSLVFYLLINQDWSISWPNIFYLIPYAWLLTLIILYFLSYFNFKSFPRAYKFNKKQLLIFIFSFSVLVAIFFNLANLPAKFHENFSKKSTTYQKVFDSQTRPWHRPSEGFISGELINIVNDKLIVRDLNHNIWEIKVENTDLFEVRTNWRFVGKMISENEFEAKQIRPWLRQGRR